MSDHYFSSNPSSASKRKVVSAELRGFQFGFFTDAGVFSKSGIDFGSELLIQNMEIPERAKVLDVGCGYGPIGLTAAKLAALGTVLLVDINERALSLAEENAKVHDITNASFIQSDGLQEVKERDFTRILTNPPIRAGKEVVHRIFTEAAAHLAPTGELWVVIQKKQGAPSAKKKLEELFLEVEDVARDAGYRIFRCRQPL